MLKFIHKRLTKKLYESYLNDSGVPIHDHPSKGGRVPYSMLTKYGTWLRRNDPIAFSIGYEEWKLDRRRG